MSELPQTLDITPLPEALSNSDPSMRVPRKAFSESADDLEITASNQPSNASVSNDIVPPQSVSNISALSSMPIFNGISFPPNMDHNLILGSERALSMFQQLDPKRIQAALDEFTEAMANKGERVRNVQAYFLGVVRRYVSAAEKDSPSHSDTHSKGAIMGRDLSPAVKVRLQAFSLQYPNRSFSRYLLLIIQYSLSFHRIALIILFHRDIASERSLIR